MASSVDGGCCLQLALAVAHAAFVLATIALFAEFGQKLTMVTTRPSSCVGCGFEEPMQGNQWHHCISTPFIILQRTMTAMTLGDALRQVVDSMELSVFSHVLTSSYQMRMQTAKLVRRAREGKGGGVGVFLLLTFAFAYIASSAWFQMVLHPEGQLSRAFQKEA